MIKMRVRVNHRVDFTNPLAQGLHAKIRPGIHQHR
jgi:hypothetical protein